MPSGLRRDGTDERRYRVNAVDVEEQRYYHSLDQERIKRARKQAAFERRLFDSVMLSITRYSDYEDGMF